LLLPTQRIEDQRAIEDMRASGALAIDDRRRRPFYFDGRFLTARDLTREQNYFLTRQSDIGRAGGAGVVHGLMVDMLSRRDQDEGELRIGAGHGITASGELVMLAEDVGIRLSDIPEIEQLNVRLGLSRLPEAPARNRTGVFVVALRPVEFTANPIASYPTSITGTRSVEDSDVIEAVAITLIPYGDRSAGLSAPQRRAQLARDLFVLNTPLGVPLDALPLALIYLERNVIQWVDPFLVRREVGADHGDILGLGFAPRAIREAHLIQYDQQLDTVLALRNASTQGLRFAASEHFQALPPAGRLPSAAINSRDFTQMFFPPEINVDLAIIPEDEVIAMIEESYLLPPIDLNASGEELEATAVVLLLPVARARFRELKTALTPPSPTVDDSPSILRSLRPAAVGMLARRRPLEVLTGLRLARKDILDLPAPPADTTPPADLRWQQELAAVDMLWYVRRRNLAYAAAVIGEPLALVTTPPTPTDNPGGGTPTEPPVDNPDEPPAVRDLVDRFELRDLLARAQACLSRAQITQIQTALARPALSGVVIGKQNIFAQNLLVAVAQLCEANDGKIPSTQLTALLRQYARARLGSGITRLKAFETNPPLREALAGSGLALALDAAVAGMTPEQLKRVNLTLARLSGDPAEFEEVARRIIGGL
jgi:hypothetical protein